VTLLVRGDSLEKSMSSYLIREIEPAANVHVRFRTEVIGGDGSASLEWIRLADRASGGEEDVAAAGLFVMIGGVPHTAWLPHEIARDAQGYVVTGRDVLREPSTRWEQEREPLALETSMSGVFAAGDVRQDSIRRVAAAVGDGATVVRLVHEHLREPQPAHSAS
jgi:thioredoxin reductase (NADPH)